MSWLGAVTRSTRSAISRARAASRSSAGTRRPVCFWPAPTRAATAGRWRGRSADLLLRGRRDGAEQPVGLVVGTRREIERVRTRVPTAAQSQCPQPIDLEWVAVGVSEGAEEIPVRIEYVDFPVPEIADEDFATKPAKGE